MLRVKVTLVYLVLVGLLVGLVTLIVQMSVSSSLRSDSEVALRRAANAAAATARLDDAALMAKARYVAQGDRLYRSLKGEFVNEKAGEGAEGGEVADFAGQRHLDAHEKLTAQKYRLEEVAKAGDEIAGLLAAAPLSPDVFMVLDNEAVGVAALGKDLYSWFGSDIGKQFPVLQKVAQGAPGRVGYWMWSFKPADEKRLYRVAMVPVRRNEGEEPAGVLVLGTMVNDGLAAKAQAVAAGSTFDPKEARDLGDDTYMDAAPEIAIYRGESIVGSTFDATLQKAVVSALAEKGLFSATDDQDTVHEVMINETTYLAATRPLTDGENSVGIVALANLDKASAPLNALRVNLVIVGVIIWLIGVALLFFLIVRYMKPIEDLETGMQEVIAGNRDYHWQPNAGHELQTGLANNLNLMSAYLQGKPMPDDDEAAGSWGDLMPGGGEPVAQKPGAVQGVDLAALSAPPPKKNDEG